MLPLQTDVTCRCSGTGSMLASIYFKFAIDFFFEVYLSFGKEKRISKQEKTKGTLYPLLFLKKITSIFTSGSCFFAGKSIETSYYDLLPNLDRWLHLLSIPYDTCSSTIPLYWCSLRQHDSCVFQRSTHKYLPKYMTTMRLSAVWNKRT